MIKNKMIIIPILHLGQVYCDSFIFIHKLNLLIKLIKNLKFTLYSPINNNINL